MASRSVGGSIKREDAQNSETIYRHNAVWYIADMVLFGMGASFINQSTVLPTFVSELTDSAFLIGLPASIQSGGWLLPQLFSARMISGKSRVRPYLVWAAALGRPVYFLFGLLIFFIGGADKTFVLASLFVAMLLFCTSDGMCGVPWFEIFGKTIPANKRGRVLGSAQMVNGIVGVALGGVVSLILGSAFLPFPYNYGALFVAGGVFMIVDFIAVAMLREPAVPAAPTHSVAAPVKVAPPPESMLDLLTNVPKEDPRFMKIVAARLFYGLGAMIFPFYIVFARRELGFGDEFVGYFLSAQVFGGILGGLLLGQLGDRKGTTFAIKAAVIAGLIAPGLGLIMTLMRPTLADMLFAPMVVLFVAVGVVFSAYLLGFMNYVLEIAPAKRRPAYTGLFNTIAGSLIVVPPLAGLLLGATSFSVLFAFSLVATAICGLLTLRLPDPRKTAHQPG